MPHTSRSLRPRNLADRVAGREPAKIFRLPIEAARRQARQILNSLPAGGVTTVVENWRQLPDGRIEFAMRRLPTPD